MKNLTLRFSVQLSIDAFRRRMQWMFSWSHQYISLWLRFVVQAAAGDAQYRAHFVTTIGVGLVQLGLALVPILLLFNYTDSVRGWTGDDVFMLVGIHQIVTGILATFIAPNLGRMTKYISQGDLDTVLIRPISAQFYLTFRWVQLPELGNVATGVAIFAFGLVRSGREPGLAEVAQAVLLVGCGLLLLACAWSLMTYLAFWMHSVDSVSELFLAILQTGRYPTPFFPQGVRAFLTFVVPVSFATTFPTEALKGGVGWWPVLAGLLFGGAAMAVARLIWKLGLRTYSSASS